MHQYQESPQRGKVVIPNQLSILIQKHVDSEIVSLDQFQYTPYNNDFGPLPLIDLQTLAKILSRTNGHQTVHCGPESKLQSRGICLLACHLMLHRNMSVKQI